MSCIWTAKDASTSEFYIDAYRTKLCSVWLNRSFSSFPYSLIPALSDSEFESIDTVMGEMHWGYIPQHKLPSSKRGQLTHDRLCQHENFARTAKECCGNLQLPVKSAFPGEVLIQDGKDITHSATVADVINEGLCDDFSTWQETHQLYHIDNDYGWFEMTSTAS
jgi:hypothetical protein